VVNPAVAPIAGFVVFRAIGLPLPSMSLLVPCLSFTWFSYSKDAQKTIGKLVAATARCTIIFFSASVLNPLDPNSPLVVLIDSESYTNFLMTHFFCLPTSHHLAEMPSGGPVKTVHGTNSFDDMWKIIEDAPQTSVLFKGALNATTQTHLRDFFMSQQKRRFPAVKYDDRYSSFHSMPFLGNRSKKRIPDIIHGKQASARDWYLNFVPLGQGKLHEQIAAPPGSIMDTSFVSHGSMARITTAVHGNWPGDTVSMQVEGRKVWMILDPEHLHTIASHVVAVPEVGVVGG
jgi:hypothetical protein